MSHLGILEGKWADFPAAGICLWSKVMEMEKVINKQFKTISIVEKSAN
jgi:hypothetical protein